MSQETTSNAVERALSIIEIVSESSRGMSNSDLSRRLKIPKSSASYILRVLENRAYLHRDLHGKYRLGLKADEFDWRRADPSSTCAKLPNRFSKIF